MKDPVLIRNCKLCRLIKIDKPLWHSVHRKILDDGLRPSLVCDWLNKQIEVRGYKLKPFNATNFSIHFSKHITTEDAKRKILNSMANPNATKDKAFTADEHDEAAAILIEKPEGDPDDIENYKFLQDYVTIAQNHIKKYGQMLENLEPNSPQGYFNSIEGFHKLLADLAKVQETLSKLKSSEKVTGQAVYIAVEMVATAILSTVIDVVQEAKELLEEQLPGSKLPEEIRKMVLGRVKLRATNAANDTLKKVYGSFNIK